MIFNTIPILFSLGLKLKTQRVMNVFLLLMIDMGEIDSYLDLRWKS